MIRVLHYVGQMKRGGMEAFIMNLYRGVDFTKYQFDFAVHEKEEGDFDQEIRMRGGNIFIFPHMRENPWKYRMTWRGFWKKNKKIYKAFHFHTNSLANCIALEEAYRAGVEVRIVHSHSSYANKGKLQVLNNYLHKKNQQKLNYLATDLIACSDRAAEWLFGDATKYGQDIKYLKNGIKLSEYAYDPQRRDQIRNYFEINPNTIVVGHVAAFLLVKNHKYLVSIAREMKKISSDFLFVLVGDGPLKSEISNQIELEGLKEHFMFLGVRSDVNELLSAFDIVVLPSLYEGLPVSMVEAQANGVPILLSDTISRDVKLNRNVSFLSINNAEEIWAKAIFENSKEHCSDLKAIVEAGYDIDGVCKTYEKILSGEINDNE